MPNREAVLAALRGAGPCARHVRAQVGGDWAALDFASRCAGCQTALADALLAAIRPPPDAEAERLRLQLDCDAADADPMACRLDAGHSRYNAVEMCAACRERAGAATLARTREDLAAAQAQERALREAVAVVARWFGPSRRAMAECRTPQDTALAEVGRVIDAALALPQDTAQPDAALRRARADALREAGATCPPCAIDPGDPPCPHAARLRRLADDAEAGS